jgi:hypothetical protein
MIQNISADSKNIFTSLLLPFQKPKTEERPRAHKLPMAKISFQNPSNTKKFTKKA